MQSFKIICTDLDRTLLHESYSDGTTIPCGSKCSVARRVIVQLHALRARGVMIVLATGRRLNTAREALRIIPHDFALLEHGGIILNRNGNADQDWAKMLMPWVGMPNERCGPLWDYARMLSSEGFEVDMDDRFTSFGVAGTQERMGMLLSRTHPEGLREVKNLKRVDILPTASGKLNALSSLAGMLAIPIANVAGLGDDYNDVEFLAGVGYPCTLPNAETLVVELVRARIGFVATKESHEGVTEILAHLASSI